MIPPNATHESAGIYYKKGSHGFIYYWNEVKKEWQKSSYTSLQGLRKINARGEYD